MERNNPAELSGTDISPSSDFLKEAEAETGANISACYGCKKCSNGCPVTFAMDFHPYQVVRYVQFGLIDRLTDSSTIWVCASCQTCLTRCPNDVDIPRLMDYLKEKVVKENLTAAQKKSLTFHQTFLNQVKARGRVHEGDLMTRYMLKTGDIFRPGEAVKNGLFGLAMFRRGRLKLWPRGTKDRKWLKELFGKQR